jgi:transposase-like protein
LSFIYVLTDRFSESIISVTCAYCGTSNYIPVRFDEDNSYECEGCGKTNSVYIKITTAQVTDIIDSENLSVSTYIKDKMDFVEKIKNK